MPTSASLPKSDGFTILEAIIVFALVGTILATVSPNLSKTFNSFSRALVLSFSLSLTF